MTKREAKRLGRERGEAAASWIFDGNTTIETYRAVVRTLNDGDPAIDDLVQAPSWLSGEWAGESIAELLGDCVTDEHMEIYEVAASTAFWRKVEHDARRGAK